MGTERKCLRCGGSNLVSSELRSTGKLYVRPKRAKLMTFFTSGVVLSGDVCFDCGHVELVADAAKIKLAMKAS